MTRQPPPWSTPRPPERGRASAAALAEPLKAVPAGFVTSFEALAAGAGLSIHHVVRTLAHLTDDERLWIPWHRVVAKGGAIGRGPWRERQFALLVREGVPVSPAGVVQDIAQRCLDPFDAASPSRHKGGEMPPAPTPTPPGQSRSRGMKDRPY